jgi:hypothetical protein
MINTKPASGPVLLCLRKNPALSIDAGIEGVYAAFGRPRENRHSATRSLSTRTMIAIARL